MGKEKKKKPTYTECYLLRLSVSSSSHSRVCDTANPGEMKDNIVRLCK